MPPILTALPALQEMPETGFRRTFRRTISNDQLPSLDAGRFVACLGVIIIHTFGICSSFQNISAIGRFSVPFFVCTAVFLIAKSILNKPHQSFLTYFIQRFNRIYMPFLFWTGFDILVRNGKQMLTGAPFVTLGPYLLANGSASHLWFLPFIMVLSLSTFFYAQRILPLTWCKWGLLFPLLLGGILVSQHSIPQHINNSNSDGLLNATYIVNLGWHAFPSVLWSLGLAPFLPQMRWLMEKWRSAKWIALTLAILLVVGCIFDSDPLLGNLAGLIFFLTTLGVWQGSIVRFMTWAGYYSYGIYLSHLAWVLGADFVLVTDRSSISGTKILLIFFIGLVGSLATSVAISRFNWLKWTIP